MLICQCEHITYANAAILRQFGYTKRAMIGMPIRDIIHRDDISSVLQLGDVDIQEDGVQTQTEIRLFKQDGSVLWVNYHTAVITYRDELAKLVTLASSSHQLKHSDLMYHCLFENTHSANMLLQNECFIDCNSEAVRMFAYRNKAQFCQLSLWRVAPPYQRNGTDSKELIQSNICITMQKGYHRFDCLLKRHDGSLFDAEVLLRRVNFGSETVIHAAMVDISLRKQKARELRHRLKIERALATASTALLSYHHANIEDVLGVLGLAMRVDRAYVFELKCNADETRSSISNTFEWCAQDVSSEKNSLQNISVERFPWWRARLREMQPIIIPDVEAMPPEAGSEQCALQQQSVRALLVVPMWDGNKQLIGYVGFDDVQQVRQWEQADIRVLKIASEMIATTLLRRRMYQQLSQNQSELLKAQEIARISSWAIQIDPNDGNYKFLVETGHIFGFPDHFIYTYKACIKQVHADDRQLIRRAAKKVLLGEQFQEQLKFRVTGICDGVTRHVHVMTDSEFDRDRLLRIFGTAQDISERIHLDELNRTVELAQAENKAKSDFLSVMSHELRTPLHGIIGLQNLLARDLPDIPVSQKENLSLARHSAQILSSLIDDILDLGKIESGAMVLNLGTFDLPQLLHNALLIFLATVRQKSVELLLQMDAIPRYVSGDERRIRQILLNLVGNAVKFTTKGCIQLHAAYDHRHDGGHLIIEISDTGMGITQENMDKLFEPFRQCDIHTDRQGTGLGTTIARKFARMMKGDINVQSVSGKGSVFTVSLPLAFHGSERISDEYSMNACVLSTDCLSTISVSSNTLHILLAEDDAISRFIVIKTLQAAGWHVDAVENGLIAWQRIQDGDYDVLLTDIRMPGMNGIELTQEVRAWEKEQHREKTMIIIGLSAHAMTHVAEQAYVAGMNAFVSKPVAIESITDQLTLLCGGSKANRVLTEL